MFDFVSYFTDWTTGLIGQSHLAAAMIALVSGAWVLWARKGTRAHVGWGYVYVISMLVMNATALAKFDLTGSWNMFHYAALGSLATLIGAFGAAIVFRFTKDRRAIATHGHLMIWSYFGLFGGLVAEVTTRAVPYMLHGEGGWMRFTITLSLFMVVTGVVTFRYAAREVKKATGL